MELSISSFKISDLFTALVNIKAKACYELIILSVAWYKLKVILKINIFRVTKLTYYFQLVRIFCVLE